jgi:small subunit ribosomal protein S21
MTEVKISKGESLERALKRLRKRIDREGTLKKVKERRHFEKPSVKRYRKKKQAKFDCMLDAKRNKEWV